MKLPKVAIDAWVCYAESMVCTIDDRVIAGHDPRFHALMLHYKFVVEKEEVLFG